ncbi:malto-oligosyltrehalose synthase [Rhabdothermincola salaria]|uniref:malto-oligosyltrehalose synthase n=1 Tax=Rhabdothermincola salaria TaxID=2903142 RepID=UPI001E581B0B|nr:malto-oligosyltrehalose synthase [Rhabdothermincola salaria]MCD9623516.1 malto-oligosyltrehalose synthase [Rhabdothermincola salaria]
MAPLVRATYRIQLTPSFGFDATAALVPYLARLGISHLYTSPLAEATPGSTHGYDVTDHQLVREELGGSDGLRRLWQTLADHDMGQVLDLVPNHMGIRSPSNRWWQSVLARGRDSVYAHHFDIDWQTGGELHGKVALPFLDRPLERAIADGAITVEARPGTVELEVRHHGDRWSASEASLEVVGLGAGDCTERIQEALDALHRDPSLLADFIDAQHWRPVHWTRTADTLNWRRFFDVTDLAGVRIERADVFDDVHDLLRRWLADDDLGAQVIQGVRIDHVDGLVDPEGYLERLRALVGPDRLIVVEKILAADEVLPPHWPVDGTTGYELTARISEVLTLGQGATALTEAWGDRTGTTTSWHDVETESRVVVLDNLLVPETRRAAKALVDAVDAVDPPHHLDLDEATALVRELAIGFDVYRTYPVPGTDGLADTDRARVDAAAERLRRRRPELAGATCDLVVDLLARREGTGAAVDRFVVRFNQLTAPLAAKAVEDTGFYRFTPLLWMNEVGGDPTRSGRHTDELHAALATTVERWPGTFVPLTTHDTKRGADVRARLGRLAEDPGAFTEAVGRARAGVAEAAPDPAFEWLLWQTLIGAWPIDPDRSHTFATKAMREAKAHTSWVANDEAYEERVHAFLDQVHRDPAATGAIGALVGQLLAAGRAASLAQVALAATAAGTPDIYQGDELWNLVLVDPDNRRPVDADRRRAVLAEVEGLDGATLVERWQRTAGDPTDDGAVKAAVLHRLLGLRAGPSPILDPTSSYRALATSGPEADAVLAYGRGERLVAVVPRRFATPVDAVVEVPSGRWVDLLTGDPVAAGPVPCATLTAHLPVAVLVAAA